MSITLNPYLMLLVFVTFMLLIFLLNQWLFKPMLAFMSNRDSFIDQEITNTQGYRGEIESATKEAKTNYEEKINAKKVENESKLAQAKQELEEQKSQLYAELLEQLPVFKNALNAKLEQI